MHDTAGHFTMQCRTCGHERQLKVQLFQPIDIQLTVGEFDEIFWKRK